ncbi:MAG TPA: alpha/beta fold hydrolase [Candidatus Limnocylindrales bacterium]|nr:alpha/beta fold hydrolase [Candidatus Limnocylindrales bacterium]
MQVQLLLRMAGGGVRQRSLPDIRRLPAGTRVPLSAAQAGIWFFTRMYPNSAEYNVFSGFEFAVIPDRQRLTAAVRTLMQRHDTLRTRVLEVDGTPMQEACDGLEPPLLWYDLRDVPPSQARQHGRQILEELAARPIPTGEAPLFRVAVVALPGGGGLIALGYHHLITDHVSDTYLTTELRALLSGRPLPPAPAAGYLDYVAAHDGVVAESRQRRDIDYWRAKLGGHLSVLELPADRPRPARPSRRGRLLSFTVPAGLRTELEDFARREATTLHTVLLAGYKIMLAQLTSQADITVGSPLVGRDTPLAERIVGCFIKPVALRTDLSGRPSFRDVVHRVQETVLAAQDHQSVAFERIVAELGVTRGHGINPVFQTIFGFQDGASTPIGDAAVIPLMLESRSARADLTVSITQADSVLHGVMEYACDLFDEATIAAYARMYLHLLARAGKAPDRLAGELELVPDDEREQLATVLNRRSARPGAGLGAATTRADGPFAQHVEPDNDTERRLVEIFRRALDLDEVSVTDGFFELGGHSMLAFKIIDACGQEFGVEPSVADFFAAASVRELAELMDAASNDAGPHLVPLAVQGGRPVVVFIHGAGGGIAAFREIARRLAPDFDVYGLRSTSASASDGCLSIEDMAAAYTAEVDGVRGSRPVILAGWSIGGCVAVEMAIQWHHRGVHVAATLLLDTWLPPSALPPGPVASVVEDTLPGVDLLGPDLTGPQRLEVSETAQRHRAAFLRYHPTRFAGRVHMLRASEPNPEPSPHLPGEYVSGDGGWRNLAAEVVTQHVPGNDHSLLAEEHAAELASVIRNIIEGQMDCGEI